MSVKRLITPLAIHRPLAVRRLHTSRVILNAINQAKSPLSSNSNTGSNASNGTSTSTSIPEEGVEITESHWRNTENGQIAGKGRQQKAIDTGAAGSELSSPARSADQAQEQPTDFFDSASPTQETSSTNKGSGAGKQGSIPSEGISLDLLSSEVESTAIPAGSRKPKSKQSGSSTGEGGRGGDRTARQGQGQRREGGRPGRDRRDATTGGQGRPGRDRRQAAGAGSSGSAPVQSQGSGQGAARPRREGKAQRESRSTGGAVTPRAPPRSRPVKENAVYDTSFTGLFGRMSLVSPARKGANDAERSFWAKGMTASDARKSDLLRLAGSYDLRLPSIPHPSALPQKASSVEKAKSLARWTVAGNPTVGMRQQEPAVSVLDRLLR